MFASLSESGCLCFHLTSRLLSRIASSWREEMPMLHLYQNLDLPNDRMGWWRGDEGVAKLHT